MPLLREGIIDATPWSQHEIGTEPSPFSVVPLSIYRENPQIWALFDGAWAVQVGPEDELDEFPEELLNAAQIAIDFPTFTDGRGYSQARLLRKQHGYQGELMATGDVRRDQIDFMAQVGIDSFECAADIDVQNWLKALSELSLEATA